MLYIFGGLPAAGKSSLALALAHHTQATYIRIDTIEQAIRNAGITVDGPAGYMIGYGFAHDNLRLGRSVIADTVNPIAITRQAWRNVAQQENVGFVEIEVICSDKQEHRRRVEERICNIPGLQQPTWQEVVDRHYEPWESATIVTDTAGHTLEQSVARLLTSLKPIQ